MPIPRAPPDAFYIEGKHGPRERIGIQHQLMDESAYEARALERRISEEILCAEFKGSAWFVSDTQIFIAISFCRIGFIFCVAKFTAFRDRASLCALRFDCLAAVSTQLRSARMGPQVFPTFHPPFTTRLFGVATHLAF
jgi:hypothetical protein